MDVQKQVEVIDTQLAIWTHQIQEMQKERAILLNLTMFRIGKDGDPIPVPAREFFKEE